MVSLHSSFDHAIALADWQRHRVATTFGVPTVVQFMVQHPSFADTDLSSLRLLICGGAPCLEPLLRAMQLGSRCHLTKIQAMIAIYRYYAV